MGMENFSSEFNSPEHYILDITYRIWEERGVGLIRDWYHARCPVRSPHGVTHTVEDVIDHTLGTMHVFPNREILADDVIIGDKPSGFYSSHRARSNAIHLGDGPYGPPTNRPITTLGIADCLCQDNQVVGEWLLRDHAGVAMQLGLDPIAHGRAMGRKNPADYAIGNEAMRQRWADPDGLTIVGDETLANRLLETYDTMWNRKNLNIMDERYDRAVRFEGPAKHICYGRPRTGNVYSRIMASIPDGRFEPHHLIVRQDPQRAVRIALRWSYCGTHSAGGRYGEPTGLPLAVLGISQFELVDGRIYREWMVVDETALYAQIAAYEEKAQK